MTDESYDLTFMRAAEPMSDLGTDPYVQGWLDCAETVASLCDMTADEITGDRRKLLDRILNPSIAEAYRHAAEIARTTTVVSRISGHTPKSRP